MKTVLITGASGGIGAAIAKEMDRAGYAVALTYNKNKENAEKVLEIIGISRYNIRVRLQQ